MHLACRVVFVLVFLAAVVSSAAEFIGQSRPPKEIKRIVSLAPNLTEMVFAIGQGEKIVGVTRYDDYPPEVAKIPKVGGFIDPSIEAIVSLKPDLVICTPNPGGKESLMPLERMGIAVLSLPSYGLEDIFSSLLELGRILQKQDQAAALAADMGEKLSQIKMLARDRPNRPRVLMVYGHQPIVAAGGGSFADSLLELAGGENVFSKSSIMYPTVPLEHILMLDPDVIIDASGGGETPGEDLKKFWMRWTTLKAVRNNRLYVFDSSVWFRPGPRVVQGVEKIFEILHGKPPTK